VTEVVIDPETPPVVVRNGIRRRRRNKIVPSLTGANV